MRTVNVAGSVQIRYSEPSPTRVKWVKGKARTRESARTEVDWVKRGSADEIEARWLEQMADRLPPPQSWYDETEDPFEPTDK